MMHHATDADRKHFKDAHTGAMLIAECADCAAIWNRICDAAKVEDDAAKVAALAHYALTPDAIVGAMPVAETGTPGAAWIFTGEFSLHRAYEIGDRDEVVTDPDFIALSPDLLDLDALDAVIDAARRFRDPEPFPTLCGRYNDNGYPVIGNWITAQPKTEV